MSHEINDPRNDGVPHMINSIAFIDRDTGASYRFDGPFEFYRDGEHVEIRTGIERDPETAPQDGDMHISTIESHTGETTIGDILAVMVDAELGMTGKIEAADIIEDTFTILVRDPDRSRPSEFER